MNFRLAALVRSASLLWYVLPAGCRRAGGPWAAVDLGVMRMMLQFRKGSLAALAALVLVGCGSAVKLDETPVESRTPVAVDGAGAAGAAGAAGRAGSSGTAGQSQVATVNLAADGGASASAAGDRLGRLVYFDFDSFVVNEEFRSMIDGHARLLAAARAKRMVIEGHTDERGGREYNLALGQKRAEAVAKSLILLGANDGQIEAVSFGKERPVNEGHDEAAWAQNRRAELKDR
jgi:peptidoglycan-associated lipoprotein